MRTLLSIACLAGATPSLPANAQQRLSFNDVAALPARPPQHKIAYGPSPQQFGHLRIPVGAGPHPVVVFIHGGCWLSAYDIRHVGPLEQALADSGYAVWSLEYRRVGDDGGGWPGTFQDVARGADHLRELAATHRLDLTRVVASGHSAGGFFALWLAARGAIPTQSELFVAAPLDVHGVLGLAPAPDLEGLHTAGVCGNVINGLMGGSPADQPARYRATSMMQPAPLTVPQTLIVGAYDRSWAPVGRAYHAHAVAAGDRQVELIEASEAGHFDVIAPPTTSWPVVVRSLRALLQRIDRSRGS